jgi:Flp pilus assembly protein TadG
MRVNTHEGQGRGHGDGGAALVEFAFVMVLLFLMVFGIITFGMILSFKQDVTRAAAEGARAGAVAVPSSQAQTRAQAALEDAVKSFGGDAWSTQGCTRPGVQECSAVVAPCSNEPAVDCVTVRLVYDYDDFPLFGQVPLVSALYPDQVAAESVARINE